MSFTEFRKSLEKVVVGPKRKEKTVELLVGNCISLTQLAKMGFFEYRFAENGQTVYRNRNTNSEKDVYLNRKGEITAIKLIW